MPQLPLHAGSGPSGDDLVFLCALGVFVYLLPAIVAALRQSPSGRAVFALNLFLGWTVIGWIVAMTWATE